MKSRKRRKLESAGWRVGTVGEFLDLSAAEVAFVEMKLALGEALRLWRTRKGLTQVELAGQLRSSQSRVAKMEAADATVSVDLLVRSLLQLGATPRDIAKVIGS